MAWNQWTNVSEGATQPGAPISAVAQPGGKFALLLADPNGGVYTCLGSQAAGWGAWSSVSEGHTVPGGPVTAVADGPGHMALFLADPGGGVYTCRGSQAAGWTGWSSVSEGSTIPGGPIAAVPDGAGRIALFLADPGGGVYTCHGSQPAGWTGWSSVSEGSTIPGGPIAALPDGAGRIVLFLADPGGGVYTCRGSPSAGWSGWSSVSEGRTTPGGHVTAIATGGGRIALFLADPGGGVYTCQGSPATGWGEWTSVSAGRTAPGARVSAVADGAGHIALFVADPAGGVFTTRGDQADGWLAWRSVSEGSTTAGGAVTAVAAGAGRSALFLADTKGGVYTTTGFGEGDAQIKHVFVLMLENRSYDHFLGFADLKGTDAETGQPTVAEGLKGEESNDYESLTSVVTNTASERIEPGPPHNFNDALIDLCGPDFDNHKPNGASYPPVKGNGYAAAYGIIAGKESSGMVMECFSKANLPVLSCLAEEFAVCDHWFSSMPGPTEPNRMFVHAASSADWDDSPSTGFQIAASLAGRDIVFANGTIFDRLRAAKVPFRIYAADNTPNVAILHGISTYFDIDELDDFERDLHNDNFDAAYTFIEPHYDVLTLKQYQFKWGNSQHPPGAVAPGEALIKRVYEAIRNSPRWNESLLVVTWDEHGGFFDHVLPPPAAPTGTRGKFNGFLFDRLGPRVPAVVISPLIPRNLVVHRTLEHSVIPATLEQLFGLAPLTVRDANLRGLQTLATLKTARTDAPTTLPNPANLPAESWKEPPTDPSQPLSEMDGNWAFALVQNAFKQHVEALPDEATQAAARIAGLKTVGDLQSYLAELAPTVAAKRMAARAERVAQWSARSQAVAPAHAPGAAAPSA